jgi:hypothetical protein
MTHIPNASTADKSRRNLLVGGVAVAAIGATPSLFSIANAQTGTSKLAFLCR